MAHRWHAGVLSVGCVVGSVLPAQLATAPANDPASITLPAATLADYTGRYRRDDAPDDVEAVFLKDGVLTIDGERLFPQMLKAEAPDRFFQPGEPVHTVFQRDTDTRVTGFQRVDPAGVTVHFTRTSADATPLNHGLRYVKTEAMVPVRDGVKLHVVVLRPEGSEKSGIALPILLSRTPYGAATSNAAVNRSKPELAASGYIFVSSDIRGRYGSQGNFVMNRPVVHVLGNHTDPKLVDESTDTYDTVAWLVKHLPNNNGRVGVFGVSYPGFLAMMAGVDHHPAVRAISPQAPMTDVWLGDDFFHNGALRQTYAFDYSLELERDKLDQTVDMPDDTYDFFLKNVNFAGAAAEAKSSNLPTTKHIIDEPAYTKSWQDMAVQRRLGAPEVPTLETGGYFDQEDMFGPQAEYAALRPHADATHKVFLALGPWNHGGWGGAGRTLSALNFGQPTGDEYRKTIEAPFFEFYLKDKAGFNLQDTASFRSGVEQWQRYNVFPPVAGFVPAKLYLGAGGTLGFTGSPSATAEAVSYVSDPAHPIPYRQRPIQSTYGKASKWRTWLAENQAFLDDRTDLARFSTPALEHDTTVTGDIVADLFASTTGTDGDFIVKLIDQYPADAPATGEAPAGYQEMIVDEIFRGRYRASFEHPEPIPAGKVQEYRWSLHAADHTFLKGHRMLVTVQSTWFPLYDRNPQTYVENISSAPASAYKPATVSIMTSAQYPSHLEVLRPTNETQP